MDQYNEQNYGAQPQQQPLPTYGQPQQPQQPQQPLPTYGQPVYNQPVQQPVYSQPVQQPAYSQPVQQPAAYNYNTMNTGYVQPVPQPVVQPANNPVHPAVEEKVGSAFGKGIASLILAEFPVASIIAIIMGSKAVSLSQEAEDLAHTYRCAVPGKRVAAKVLGTIGRILGIVMTIFWAFYFFAIIGIAASGGF